MMRAGTLALFVLLLMAVPAATQTAPVAQPVPVATVRGVVVDAENGAALARARVEVTSSGQPVGMVISDDRGAFSIATAVEGRLSIRVVKAGYAFLRRDVTVARPGNAEPLLIQVPRGAAIAGRMIDSAGEPATWPTARVRRLPEGASAAPGEIYQLRLDERGEFRIGGLLAGRYIVEGYAALTSSAPRPVTVDLAPGMDVAGVDLVVERRELGVVPDLRDPAVVGSTIRGTVSTPGGAPIADAAVTVRQRTRMWGTTTDLRGQFTVGGVSPGTVTVSATKRGYLSIESVGSGVELPVPTVTVESGRDVDNVALVLPRRGIVTGTVVDEHGDPLPDAGVHVLRVRRSPSGLVATRDQGTMVARTDDRGAFRLFEISPGDYIVTATLPAESVDQSASRRTAYVPAYYPDAHDLARAAAIRIGSEEEVTGVHLIVRRVPVVRVTGRVSGADGQPLAATVRLIPRLIGVVAPEARTVHAEATGEFVFADVPSGDYLVQAIMASGVTPVFSPSNVNGPSGPQFASATITVADHDPDPLLLRTSPGSSVSGQLVLEGGVGELLWGYSFSSIPVDVAVSTSSRSTRSGPMGTGEPFSFAGLTGPTRLRVWSDDANWYLKSILINGVEAADAPFDFGFDGRTYADVDIVFSRAGASIGGRVTDARATPARDSSVYVFSPERETWIPGSRWVKLARATADGSFRVVSLPPGDYWVAAVDRVDAVPGSADWIDPELLEALVPRATRISVGVGEARVLDLRLSNR